MYKKFILLLLLPLLFLFGCDGSLGVPSNLEIDDDVVSWRGVLGAEKYVVVVDDEDYEVTTTSFNLGDLNLAEGEYQITIIAVKGEKVSLPSQAITYTVGTFALATPTNLRIDGDVLRWEAVEGATSYSVHIGSSVVSVTTNQVNLDDLPLKTGDNAIQVRAHKDDDKSALSQSLTHNVAPGGDPSALFASLLLKVDPTYQPNLTDEDFESEDEYAAYSNISIILEAFVNAALEVTLTEEEVEALFDAIVDFADNVDDFEDFSDFEEYLEPMFGVLNADGFAHIIYEMAITALPLIIESQDEAIAYFQNEILEAEEEVTNYKNGSEFTNLYDQLLEYIDEESLPIINYFIDNIADSYDVLEEIYSITREFNLYQDYYAEIEDPAAEIYYQILYDAYEAEDEELINLLFTYYNDNYSPFLALYYLENDVLDYNYYLEQAIKTKAMVSALQGDMENDESVYYQSLEVFYTFFNELYGTLSADLFEDVYKLFSNQLTPGEMIILKDEIVTILQDILPEEDDFERIYLMYYHIFGIIADVEIASYLDDAGSWAKISHTLLDLELKAMLEVDEEFYTFVMTTIEELDIPSYPEYDEYGDIIGWYPGEYNYHKVIELMLFLGEFYLDFTEENAVAIAELKALDYANLYENTLTLVFDFVLKQLPTAETETYEMVADIKELVIENLETLLLGYQELENIGREYFLAFIETEGLFFDEFINLQEQFDDFEDTVDFVEALEELIDKWAPYQEIVSQIETSQLEKVISLYKAPFQISLMQAMEVDQDEFNEFYLAITDDLVYIYANILSLQTEAYSVIDALDISALFEIGFEDEDSAMLALILVLDEVLNEENEELVFSSLNTLFDNVVEQEFYLSLLEIEKTESDQKQAEIINNLETIFEDIHLVAGFNFNELQETELDAFNQLVEDIANFFD